MYHDIEFSEHDGIALLRLHRPSVLNAIRVQTYQDVIHALHRCNHDDAIQVVIITGSDEAFTAGNDLTDLLPGGDLAGIRDGVAGIFDALAGLSKPLIIAQEGLAVGIGANILLHADLAYAGKSTRYALPFARIGVTSEGASSVLLAEAIGPKRASELLLSGRFFSAMECQTWGLLNAVVEDGQALEQARQMATTLTQQSAPSLRAIKALGRAENHRQRVNQAVEREMVQFSALLNTADTQARIQHVLKKRA